MNYAGGKFEADLMGSLSTGYVNVEEAVPQRGQADTVTISDPHLLFTGNLERSGTDLIISDREHRVLVHDYFRGEKRPTLISSEGAPLDSKFVEALTGHTAYAQAGAAPAAKIIGQVVKMTGSASVVRNGVTIAVNTGDNVYQNDVVQTGSGSTLGIVLIDGTTFNMTASARLMLNDLVYDANSTSNTSLFTLVQGATSFVAGQVAKTGDMKVATPVATVGVRGTAVILDISSADGKVSISVVDQQDGQVHAVQVFNTAGNLIGTVTSNGTSLTLTPTANFNVIAQESNKTPAQVAQEFNAFQQVLSTYDIGKQLVPNLPPPSDGKRGDANPQSTTKFAGSAPSAPSDTPVTTLGPVGGNTANPIDTAKADAVKGTSPPPSSTAPAAPSSTPSNQPPPTIVVLNDPFLSVPVVPTAIPFVVVPSPVTLISPGSGDHFGPVMSADGRFVTYDPDGAIFLFDRQSNTTITIASPANGFTYSAPSISSDGHYIVYQGWNGAQSFVFIYDNIPSDAHYRQTTQLAPGSSPAISGDGSVIVVEHGGSSLVVYDQHGHTIATITPAAIGQTGAVWKPAVSAYGHVIAFWSSDAGTAGGSGHLFVYNLSSGSVAAIANTTTGAGASAASISADGHYVVYQSDGSSGHSEIYLYDLIAGHVVFQTAQASGASYNPAISPDGHFIIFASDARLTPDDTNSVADTYVVDVTNPSQPVFKLVSALADGTPGNAASNLGASISAGGLLIAFGSSASNLSTGGAAGSTGNIFVVDPSSGHSVIIQESVSAPALLTASGVVELTGDASGVKLSVSDQSGKFSAAFDSNRNIQWNFNEAKSDFAFLQPGQVSSQKFFITLSTDVSTTTIPIKISVYDADLPTITVADVAPVASPVHLAPGTENVSYTVTAAALLAGVADIDGPSLSITAVTIKSGGGALADNLDGTWTYTPPTGFAGAVTLNYTASDGTLRASSTASFDLASVAPTIAISTAGATTNQTTQTIAGTVTTVGAALGGTVALFDNGSTTPIATTSVGIDGSWTAKVVLAEGMHSIVAVDTDSAGNTGSSTPVVFTIDISAPTEALAITAIATDSGTPGDFITNDTTLTVSGTNGPLAAGDKIQLSSNGGLTWTDVTQNSATGWSLIDPTTHGASFIYQVRIIDAAGNIGTTASQAITIDTSAPAVSIIGFTPDSGVIGDGITNATTVTVNGIAEIGSVVTLYDGLSLIGTTIADGSGNWSISESGLTNGSTHSFTATATDKANNTSAPTAALSVTIVTQGPTEALAITAIATDSGTPGDFITNDTTLTVSGTNGTLAAGDKIQVSSNGGLTWTDVTQNSATGWSLIDPTTHGASFIYQARIIDAAGNIGTTASQAITIDTSAPAPPAGLMLDPTTDSGTVGDNKTGVQALKIDGSAEAGATVTVYDTGGTTVIGTGSANAITGAFSITTSLLSQGIHTITAKATDAAGNTSAASAGLAVTIDLSAPTEALAIMSIAGSSLPNDTTVTVSGSNGPLTIGDKIQISADGLTWTDVVQTSATTWSFADTVMHTGNFTYRTRVVDPVANVGATATLDVLVAYNGGAPLVVGSPAFVAEFTGTGGSLQLGPSPGITGTINAISVASGPVAVFGSGSVTSNTGDAIDLSATGGTAANPANLSLNLAGPVTGAASGLNVVQNAYGAITITTSGPVIGQAGQGIFAEESATGIGSILINASGNVTGTNHSAIFAENLNAANGGDVTVGQTGNVNGGRDGIRALTLGNGNVTVVTGQNAAITANLLYGIEASSSGAGNIAVTTAAGDVITSRSAGIDAYSQATSIPQVGGNTVSSISIAANGTINSGSALTGNSSRPAGILAGYKGGATNTTNPGVFGNVTVDNFANINAAGGDGVRAYNFGSGDVTVNDHAGTSIVAKDAFGISASSNGSGKVSITTAAGDVVSSGSSGLQAINLATAISVGAASTVSVTANGAIHSGVHLTPGGSQPQGISAGYFPGNFGASNTNVNGTVLINNFANVTADAGWGINAYNYANGSVTVTDGPGTVVSGAQYGIAAYSSSSGPASSGSVTINIGANATITAGALYGLAGITGNATNAGNISITTSAGDIINSGGTGIQASNSATNAASSQISITTLGGTINSGFDTGTNGGQPGGIWAGYNPAGQGVVNSNVHGNVVVDNAANINAASGVGIGLYNFGVGNLSATIEAASTISAVTAGVNAFAQGGGDVTIANSGTLSAASGIGIIAGTGNGLGVTGGGTISIGNTGTINALGSANISVIQINNNSLQGATFTNSGTVTSRLFSASSLNVAVGANNGNIATNTGRATVNNTGTISGNVALGTSAFNIAATTFNNNIGGVWNVNGSNWFGGLANTIDNSGAINIAAFSSFFSAIGGAFGLHNSGTVNVLANSAAYIGAAVSGNGTFIINNRGELEFAGSVAGGLTGQTVSFAPGATGVLTLDNPAAFAGTISGLAIGDTIDFLGGIAVSGASISGSTLTVSSTIGNLNYTVSGAQAGTMFNVLSADKIVMVPTAATIVSGSSAPYAASAAGFYIFSNDAIIGIVNGIDINALADSNPAHYVSVNFNQGSSIAVGSANAVNLTTGIANIALVNAGTLSGGIGINTVSGSGSTDIINYGNVSGGQYAIAGHTTTGTLNIVVGGGATISSSTSYGIFAGTTSGALDVTTVQGVTINSGSAGILAQDQWSGLAGTGNSISIVNSATVNSGSAPIVPGTAASGPTSAPAGIRAGILNGTSATQNPSIVGDVSVNNLANITAAAGSGIFAFNYGSGNVAVSDGSGTNITTSTAPVVPGSGATQYGIFAFNYGKGSATVTTGFGSTINSGGTGINAGNQASAIASGSGSTVTVVALGAINSGANNNNSGSAPSGIQAGYNPNNGSFTPGVFGDVLVSDGGNIIAAAGDGINAYNYGTGNVAVNLGFGVSIQALTSAASQSGNGNAPFGIGAFNYGPGNIQVTTSGGDTINSGSSGINASNQSSAIAINEGALVAVSTAGSIHSGVINNNNNGSLPSGIVAGFLGGTSPTANPINVNGTVIVNNAANIVADAGFGINAYNFGSGDVTVNDASGTTISGAQYGIYAHAESGTGTGNVAVNVYANATVNSTSSYGIFAVSTDAGNISVITSSGDFINSGSIGIDAVNQAASIDPSKNSSIVVTAGGTIHSGSNLTGTGNPPAGIVAGYLGPTPGGIITPTFPLTAVNGEVVVNSFANINADSGDGIRAFNYGIGDVTVNDFAGTITTHASPVNGFGNGISATNQGTGSIHVTTAAGTIINSAGSGISALNRAPAPPATSAIVVPSTSEISVLAFGTINSGAILSGSGDPAAGILAGYNPTNADTADNNVHGNVSIDDYASISAPGGTDGIRGVNYGTGTVTIIAESGATISAGRYGIGAFGYNGGNVSVTNSATVAGTTAAIDATTSAAGTASIDNFGTIVGNIISGNVTFHNEFGAIWYLAGNSTFATAADVLINDGTINVLSGSLGVGASVSGTGLLTLGNGATLEFGSSVGAGETISFLGANGAIKLDHSLTAPFVGQIANLNGTALNYDTIDLADLAWNPAASAQYQATIVNGVTTNGGNLIVSDGIGHTEAFRLANYTGSGHFVVQSDGHGGSIVFDNQAPSIAGDMAVIVVKGGAIALTTNDLNAADPLSSPQQLVYTVLSTTHGHLQLGNNPTTTFTLQDIQSGLVSFVADDPSYVGAGSFAVSLSDGVPGVAASVAKVGVNIVDAQLVVLTGAGYNFDREDPILAMATGTIIPDALNPGATFEIINTAANRDFAFSGTGFAYAPGTHALTAGTITSIIETTDDAFHTPLVRFDLHVPAVDWMNAVIAKTIGDKAIESLTSSWTFNFIGNAGPDAFGSANLNDVFTGNGGNDTFDGQFGYDRASYSNATGPISVQLAAGIVTGDSSVGTDTLKSIELVTGTNFADSFDATGFSATSSNAGSTVTSNTAGLFNEFEGRAGNDTIIGNGATRISYYHATAGVTVTFNPANSWATASSGASGIATGDASVGSDTFTGVNQVRGSFFDDTFTGSNNPSGTSENFEGLGGNDTINGGGGFDRAMYFHASDNTGIVVNLAAGIVTGGPDTGTDTLRSVEAIYGTNFADNYDATGFTATSTNAGSAGVNGSGAAFNEFEGGGGNDQVTGNGNTRVAFYHAAAGVVVTLGTNGSGVADGDASVGHDTLISGVSAVRGSEFNDIITGNGGNNILEGQGGNDVLIGNGGNDTLTGGTGSDIFVFRTDGTNSNTPPSNNDTITDFSHSDGDRIDLRAITTVHGLTDLLSLGTQFGPDTVFNFGPTDSLTLKNVMMANLTASDFIFNVTTGSSVAVTVQTPDGYDFSTLYDDLAASGLAASADIPDHMFAVDASKGVTFELIGTGFTYDASSHQPLTGIITEIDILNTTDPTHTTQDYVLVNTNGWHIDAASFFAGIGSYAANHTGPGLASLNGIFNAATYSIVGSAGFADNNGSPHDGADVFFGGDHADVFNGMPGPFGPFDPGRDTVDYSHATAGITADLSGHIAGTGAAAGDIFISIENLRGTGLNDTLIGDGNNNVLEGGLGTNTLDGGGGFDTASYEHAAGAVTVSLAVSGPQSTGGAGTDTLINIEGLRGSNYNDTLTGNGSGVLEGGAGNDTLIGVAGGNDTASYAHATAGVSVSLSITGPQNTSGAGTDTLTNIANLTGSQFNDILTGDSHNNTLFGNGGNDTFVFNETMPGGIGHDTIGDFMPGQDKVELDYLAFNPADPASFASWLATHAAVSNGNDLLIDLNVHGPNQDTILLKNCSLASLHASDFILRA